MLAVVLSGLVGGCGSGWVRRVPGGLLGVLVLGRAVRAVPMTVVGSSWKASDPACSAGAPARRADLEALAGGSRASEGCMSPPGSKYGSVPTRPQGTPGGLPARRAEWR